MICPHCGREYSDKVWRIHKERCKPTPTAHRYESREQAVEAVMVEHTKADLVELAEIAGVEIDKRWSKNRIAEALNASHHA